MHPVRGAALIGKGAEVLMKIDRVGQQLELGQGMCGSLSGSIPTSVGAAASAYNRHDRGRTQRGSRPGA